MSDPESPSPDEVLKMLLAGNQRYVNAKPTHPHQAATRRAELAAGQKPFAIILGCSDSRVPPELVFDQGLGDLFVVRVAGNITDCTVMASIEYAARLLHIPLLMVLAHSRCGAVAVAAALSHGEPLEGHLACFVTAIEPAMRQAQGRRGDLIDNTTRANAKLVAERLVSGSEIVRELAAAGRLKVVPAYCDLATGAVTVLS